MMNPKKRKLAHEELGYFANHIEEIDDINFSSDDSVKDKDFDLLSDEQSEESANEEESSNESSSENENINDIVNDVMLCFESN